MLKGLVVLQWLLAPLPGLLILGLYLLSARAQHLIGKFPQPFVNDPGTIGSGDGLYQMLDQIVGYLLSGTLYSALLWVPLTIATLGFSYRDWSHRRSRRIVRAAGLAISLYILGTVVLWFEPSNRLGWYFD